MHDAINLRGFDEVIVSTLPVRLSRWLKLDRTALSKTGGLAIYLGDAPRIDSVADRVGEHPWAEASNGR